MQWRSANPYFRARFGCKVYKLALDGGMTCPNRDGKLDTRGCIFCSAGGSGDFAEPLCGSIEEQLDRAKSRVAAKAGPDARYIAYFQSYTNTYAPAERLEALFAPVLARPEIVALSGDARTKLLNAVKKAKDGERDAARALVDEAQGLLNDAHTAQTDLLTAEARGEVTSPTVLLVHAQDHLMTTMLLRDVIDALMDIYR